MTSSRRLIRGSLAALALLFTTTGPAETSAFRIIDDPMMNATITAVRARYLTTRTWDRLNCTILVKQPDGSWLRGSYNPDELQYPASCVKLAYMAAAAHWCRENGHPPNHLDEHVRPMIVVSDNVATGRVVDAISGAPNFTGPDAPGAMPYEEWKKRRLYTPDFLASRGLLDDQVIVHKTYPTNSGESPAGYEAGIKTELGGNLMQARLSASLMLEIAGGALEPQATTYMRGLLTHERWDDDAIIGPCIPPGSVYENKVGVAYDTAEDIAYVRMPNGREFVIAIYTNSWKRSEPQPYDAYQPAPFVEQLIGALGLMEGNPPRVVVDDASKGFSSTGTWSRATAQADKHGSTVRHAAGGSGATATFTLAPPEAGTYEVAVWYAGLPGRAKKVPFTVHHADGTNTVTVDQDSKEGLWVRLGDYRFAAGEGSVVVGTEGVDPSAVVVADAVRLWKHPEAGKATAP